MKLSSTRLSREAANAYANLEHERFVNLGNQVKARLPDLAQRTVGTHNVQRTPDSLAMSGSHMIGGGGEHRVFPGIGGEGTTVNKFLPGNIVPGYEQSIRDYQTAAKTAPNLFAQHTGADPRYNVNRFEFVPGRIGSEEVATKGRELFRKQVPGYSATDIRGPNVVDTPTGPKIIDASVFKTPAYQPRIVSGKPILSYGSSRAMPFKPGYELTGQIASHAGDRQAIESWNNRVMGGLAPSRSPNAPKPFGVTPTTTREFGEGLAPAYKNLPVATPEAYNYSSIRQPLQAQAQVAQRFTPKPFPIVGKALERLNVPYGRIGQVQTALGTAAPMATNLLTGGLASGVGTAMGKDIQKLPAAKLLSNLGAGLMPASVGNLAGKLPGMASSVQNAASNMASYMPSPVLNAGELAQKYLINKPVELGEGLYSGAKGLAKKLPGVQPLVDYTKSIGKNINPQKAFDLGRSLSFDPSKTQFTPSALRGH